MATVEIKSRWSGAVLFSAEVGDGVSVELQMKVAVEMAVKARANLADAYLADANLARANLAGANLAGAYLADANLAGAYLADAKIQNNLTLIGKRPCVWFGPIGSVSRTFYGWLTNDGIHIQSGCFFGTTAEFRAKLTKTHGGTIHEQEYLLALSLVEKHFELFPAEVAVTDSSEVM